MYWYFPETNKRTLEDMDAIFISSQGYHDVVKVAKRMTHASILAVANDDKTNQTDLRMEEKEAIVLREHA